MKKINLILLTLVLTLSFSSFAQSNVAHVNSQEIIALMPETIAADAEIKSIEATYTKEIEGYLLDISTKLPGHLDELYQVRSGIFSPVHRGDQAILIKPIRI